MFCDGRDVPDLAIYEPKKIRLVEHRGGSFIGVGFRKMTSAFLRLDDSGTVGDEVYEGQLTWSKSTGMDLAEWTRDAHEKLKRALGKRAWEKVVIGPVAFSLDEIDIIASRSKIRWKVVGFTPDRLVRFEVTNNSSRRLEFFTIGVEDIARIALVGAVALPIDEVLPGQTKIIATDCYRDMIAPEKLRLFDLPLPTPETRKKFWELRFKSHTAM